MKEEEENNLDAMLCVACKKCDNELESIKSLRYAIIAVTNEALSSACGNRRKFILETLLREIKSMTSKASYFKENEMIEEAKNSKLAFVIACRDKNVNDIKPLLQKVDSVSDEVFEVACRDKGINTIEFLLEKVDHVSDKAFEIACEYQYQSVIELLLQKVDSVSDEVFEVACRYQTVEVIDSLLKRGASMTDEIIEILSDRHDVELIHCILRHFKRNYEK